MTMVLFRMVKLASGVIFIDGKDISTLGLNTVRRALSIIPQVSYTHRRVVSSRMLTPMPFNESGSRDVYGFPARQPRPISRAQRD